MTSDIYNNYFMGMCDLVTINTGIIRQGSKVGLKGVYELMQLNNQKLATQNLKHTLNNQLYKSFYSSNIDLEKIFNDEVLKEKVTNSIGEKINFFNEKLLAKLHEETKPISTSKKEQKATYNKREKIVIDNTEKFSNMACIEY